jgi:hypothetical protein
MLKRIFNWLFGKYWGYTPVEIKPVADESKDTEQSFEPPKVKKIVYKKTLITTSKKLWRNWHTGKEKDIYKKYLK